MNQEKIIFQNNKNQKLVGLLTKPQSNKFPIVIFVHGYRSDKNSSKARLLAKEFSQKEIGFFAIDLSGRGESEGTFEDTTITQYIDDLKCAIDEISKYTNKIGIVGNSLGGIVSLQEISKDDRINVLVLLSPVSKFPLKGSGKDFTLENVKKWKEQGYILTYSKRFGDLKIKYDFYEDGLKYDDYNVYKTIGIPVLVIHGTNDESVLFEDSNQLINHLKDSKLIILEGADHNYTNPNDKEKVIKETVNFIQEVLL